MNFRSPSEIMPPRKSAVSRADLAWLLHVMPGEQARQAARLFDLRYEKPPEEESERREPHSKPPEPPPRRDPELHVGRPPLRATHFAVIEHQRFPEEGRDSVDGDNGVTFASVQSDSGQTVPRFIPLSGPSRLAVFLRRTLRSLRTGREIDLSRLIGHLVCLRLPCRLPREARPHWSDQAILVVDLSLAAWPLRDDLIDLAEQAHALSAGRLPVLCRDHAERWLRRQPGRRPVWEEVDDAALWSARHWLIAGDAESLRSDPAGRRYWLRRCQAHLGRGGQLTVLTGQGSVEWASLLPRRAELVAWEFGRRLVAPAEADSCRPDGSKARRLLAALSMAVVVEPALLREIRLALGLSMGCELAAWNHSDSQPCVLGMQLRIERLAHYRQQLLLAEDLPARRQIAQIIARHHRGHSQLIRLEEAALAADLADFDTARANADWARAVRTLRREPQGGAARELAAYLRRTGLRAHESLWRSIPNLADAYVIARREDLEAGASIPAGLPANVLEKYLTAPGHAGVARRWWLVQTAADLVVTTEAPQLGQFLLAECELAVGFDLQTPEHARQWHPLRGGSERLDTLRAGGGPWVLRSARERIVVAEVPRPSWALAWGRDPQGLYAIPPSLAGRAAKLYWNWDEAVPTLWPPPARGFRSPRQQVAPSFWQGADLEYGLYLDVDLAGVVQRFRWIEPGEFLMGSPADEPGRFYDEGPRHRVRLTAGYWLAETACTQALWQAVMGDNPSRFNDDPEKPVDWVSWDDVQAFLQRVQAMLAGVAVQLPSEAEWEYACRAGSEGAYTWGETITPEQANYGSSGTVPVRSYPPNAWGLYEMHGNVWEWCADGKRQYGDAVQENLRGPEDQGAPRVVRGGSGSSGAGRLRSAFRVGGRRVIRGDELGVRFSLRSTSPVAGTERQRQERVAPEGPPASVAFPGREGGVVSAVAETAPSGPGSRAVKTGTSRGGSASKRK